MNSEAVGVLQTALNLCNGRAGLGVDNDFGNQTEAAVKAVQKAHGITQDSGYGNQTRGVMTWPDNETLRCVRPTHF